MARTLPILATVLAMGSVMAGPVVAQVAPGSPVTNTATLDWSEDGVPYRMQSNTNSFAVAERLDVAVSVTGPLHRDGDNWVAPLLLTNTGNGREAFVLQAEARQEQGQVSFALESGRSSEPDPGSARPMEGGVTPVLDPGQAAPLLVIVAAADEVPQEQLSITARTLTGSGPPGQSFPGQGDNGADAVIGGTGAEVRAVLSVADAPVPTMPTLVKAQSVADPAGGSRAERGATVTYMLTAGLPAGSPAATIADSVPAGTRFRPGSLSLDGALLTDADDADPGNFNGGAVAVALPAAATAAIHHVRFQVIIQ